MIENYPTVQVEKPNKEYAKILLQDYAGSVSEETAIHNYLYQHFVEGMENEEFADLAKTVALNEMTHLGLLGETIKLLGIDPKFYTIQAVSKKETPWTSLYVSYPNNLLDMIQLNIESEKKAILKYEMHKEIIQDQYIQELLSRIIQDEKEHIRLFEEFKKNYILRQKD